MGRRIDDLLSRAGLPPLERAVWIEVDVDRLTSNATELVALAAPAELAAVVKADGYGHGLEMAARCAATGGASWLCVANAGEAIRLRNDGYSGRVFTFYPVPIPMVTTMARLGIDVTVGSMVDLDEMAAVLNRAQQRLNVHLEIDTGMTRGGISPETALELAVAIVEARCTELVGIWTHLAAPEDEAATESQLNRFDGVLTQMATNGIDPGVVHAAASGGLLAADTDDHDLVRIGLALYGNDPHVGQPLSQSVQPALSVRSHAIRIAEVPTGTEVGYARTWTAGQDSRIATLPVGYADGWPRSLSPGSSVLISGRRAPLVGRVSSDALAVDVTGIENVGPESEFTLLGRDGNDEITPDEVAEMRGTISWEVLQQLGARMTRVFMSDGVPIAMRPESTVKMSWAPGTTGPTY